MAVDSVTLQIRHAHHALLLRERDAQIGSAPIFAGLSEADRFLLAERACPVDVPAGACIVVENEPGSDCFLIWSGAVDVEDATGRAIGHFEAGELVGEIAAASRSDAYKVVRTATVRATEDCSLFAISADTLERLMNRAPVVRARIRTLIQGRITPEQLHDHLRPRDP